MKVVVLPFDLRGDVCVSLWRKAGPLLLLVTADLQPRRSGSDNKQSENEMKETILQS